MPGDIYAVFSPLLAHLDYESLRIALVDTKLKPFRFVTVSDGGLNETCAHPRDILHPVVLHKAYGFALVHNHPSGDPAPSRADRDLTKRLAASAAVLGVTLLDHLIIGRPSPQNGEGYFSFMESGLL